MFSMRNKTGIVFVGFLVIAGYVLILEHGTHLAPYLPWLILLACPLMHLFMHHGHGSQKQHHDSTKPKQNERKQTFSIERKGHNNGGTDQ